MTDTSFSGIRFFGGSDGGGGGVVADSGGVGVVADGGGGGVVADGLITIFNVLIVVAPNVVGKRQ